MKRFLRFGMVVLALATLCPLSTVQARKTGPGTRITHTYEDKSIGRQAELSENGLRIRLTMGGPAAEHPAGTTIHVTVAVYQPQTDALALGHGKGVPVPPDGPDTATFSRTAHAIGRSRFEEGPAIACYFAEVRFRGKLVREWSRCKEVVLQHPVVTLKGPLRGRLTFDKDDSGFATYLGVGRLNLMGRVVAYGEFQFDPGEEEGTQLATGVTAFLSEDGEFLVASVKWFIDADGNGDLEFRWPGEVTFRNGLTVASTGPFVELPFGGLRGVTTELPNVLPPTELFIHVRMTGEIVDPDPLDR